VFGPAARPFVTDCAGRGRSVNGFGALRENFM